MKPSTFRGSGFRLPPMGGFLRSQCSTHMWCPDDIGRDSWVWVVAPSQGESMTHFPRSGVVSPRRKTRIVASKRNVPGMKWLLLLLLNVIYSKQIIIDKDVDRGRLRLAYQKCSPIKHFFKKINLASVKRRTGKSGCWRSFLLSPIVIRYFSGPKKYKKNIL